MADRFLNNSDHLVEWLRGGHCEPLHLHVSDHLNSFDFRFAGNPQSKSTKYGDPFGESELFRGCKRCTLNYICNFLGMRYVDRMARACDFDHVAMSSLGVPPFKVSVDGSVFFRYNHPTWFASPRS